MNIKDYLKRNGMTLILLVGMIILYLCIPSQIAENMVAKATISPRFFPTFSVLGVIVCCALLLVFDAKEHKAIEEQEEYKRKLRESEAAMKSNYKALGSMMDQQRKAGNQSGGDSLLGSLKNAGLFKMAGDALSQAAGAGLESALGQPTATAVSSILSGIASGAAMGAVTGTPHGVAAGALVGAGVGIVNAATAVGKASDGAFKSYVQEAAESQLAQRDSDITSGSSIAARRETDLISFSTLFKDRSVAKGYLEELVTIALSAARSGIGATAVGGYALFGGGELGSGNSAIVDAYDENLTRITLPNLSSARYGLAATSVGVYALFGGGSPSASSAIVDVYAA